MVRIDFNRLRFLVIDDNAHMRRIIRTLLHGFGAREVYEAEDGAAGLEAFTHYIPDVVITDWAMPIEISKFLLKISLATVNSGVVGCLETEAQSISTIKQLLEVLVEQQMVSKFNQCFSVVQLKYFQSKMDILSV